MIDDDKTSFIEYGDLFEGLWNDSQSDFMNNIFIVCEPFALAAEKAETKLKDLFEKTLCDKEINIIFTEVFICDKFVFFIHFENIGDQVYFKLFWFEKHGGLLMFFDGNNYDPSSWFSKHLNFKNQNEKQDALGKVLSLVINLHLFRKYASVETKILPPNKKIKEANGLKHFNETKLAVTILDSKWFTNLVQSNAFKVSGHFRLQPCGPLLQDRKIIWINEFEKTGYHASARILNQNHVVV